MNSEKNAITNMDDLARHLQQQLTQPSSPIDDEIDPAERVTQSRKRMQERWDGKPTPTES